VAARFCLMKSVRCRPPFRRRLSGLSNIKNWGGIGSPVPKRVRVCAAASAHRDLRKTTEEHRLREHLLYRLAMIEIRLPRPAETVLAPHSRPGNPRELEGVLESAALMAESPLIDIGDLLERLRRPDPVSARIEDNFLVSLEGAQHRLARRVVERLGGDKAAAAQVPGVSRATL